MIETFSFEWPILITNLIRLCLAFVFALPIAWERLQGDVNLGLRTFPIVAMASCGYMLLATSIPDASAETQARVLQGLLAGIGFIGGGAIVKQGFDVRGIATAASVWTTGAIGAAVAMQRAEIALVLAAINFLTLRFLTPVAEKKRNGDDD